MTKETKKPASLVKERRKEGRLIQENKVKFRITFDHEHPNIRKTYYALTRDISVGGMRILTEKYLPAGTELQMELALMDSNKLLNLTGRIIWVSSLYGEELYEMGIEYMGASTEKIIALIEHLYER